MKNNYLIALIIGLLTSTTVLQAQERFNGNFELRPRFEYRNGYKELMPDGNYPTSFVSNRARLNLGYGVDKLNTYISFQNVSVWGDVNTTSLNDKNGIKLFQAWASYKFTENWSTKIGRQVLSYDNQRILGEIGWAQQAQSHDAAMVTYSKYKSKLDVGFSFGNTGEVLYESAYANTYKNMQFAWFHHDFSNFGLSILALNTGNQYENADSGNLEVTYLQTMGVYGKWGATKKFYGDAGVYSQFGKTPISNEEIDVSAFYGSVNLGYKFTEKVKGELGFEYLSGTDQDDDSGKIKSFTPLFGTNHGFNGYMDYFYVGNHKNNVGLIDYYASLKYQNEKWQFTLTPHIFNSDGKIFDPLSYEEADNYLGTEIDLSCQYTFDKNITVSGGYSQMFGRDSLEYIKGGNKDNTNNWAWIMISIHPKLF